LLTPPLTPHTPTTTLPKPQPKNPPKNQGRLPIRVELKGLTAADFGRILREPEYNLVRQQQLLLAAEGVDLEFTDDAVDAIAAAAAELNASVEDVGARRLHTVIERLVADVSFDAPELAAAAADGDGSKGESNGESGSSEGSSSSSNSESGGSRSESSNGTAAPPRCRYVVDAAMVKAKLSDLAKRQDLSRFIL
jgi:ATP-dependent HslUV protease ATP-binding subunit HslU